jgi:hypothetical protein
MARKRTSNEIASLFLIQVLLQEKGRLARRLELLAEADEGGDEDLANHSLDEIGWACILGDVRGDISYRQWKWIRDVANQEHAAGFHQEPIVAFEGQEAGFWSYSWPTETRPSMHYIMDPWVIQAYMSIPDDVLARAAKRCLEEGTDRPINRWMMRKAR